MDIATMIDQAMREKRLTQKALSERSGVPQATISRTLKGKSTPETGTLAKLFGALGLSTVGIYAQQGGDQPKMANESMAPSYHAPRMVALAPPSVTLDLDADCLLVWQQLQQLAPEDRERWRAELALTAAQALLAKLPPRKSPPIEPPDRPRYHSPKTHDPA